MAQFSNESTYKKFLEDGKETYFDEAFDSAVAQVKKETLGKEFPLFIGGKEASAKDKLVELSPIDKSKIGVFQKGTQELARNAIDAAFDAFPAWQALGYRERTEIFRKAASIFSREKFNVAAILSIENGKSRYESIGEVDEAIDFLRYYADLVDKNKGYILKNKSQESTAKAITGFQGAPGKREEVTIKMRPYGVFGVIAPFNFPISISVGMSTGALITGNAVVFKPSSTGNMTMLSGFKIYEIFKEAGLPAGVFNYISGPGSEIGDEFVTNPKVSGIAFTGSRAVGLGMIKKSNELGSHKVFVVEMGGKNPVIVSKYADLDAAAKGIISSAFGFCGQKCSATSRVYIQESVKEEFVNRLLEKAQKLNIGNPLNKGVYIGPLISEEALKKYKSAVDEAGKSGKILFGGKQVDIGLKGIYTEPTIAELDEKSRLFREELFTPFLVLSTYKTFDGAMKKANETEYGLTAGLYSKKRSEIKKFFNGILAGVTYVNREIGATTGAMVGLHSFVGWKNSGLTGKGTGSRFYLEQFMHEQSQSLVK